MAAQSRPRSKRALEPILVRLPLDLRAEVREVAMEEDLTQAQLIRRALREFLARRQAVA